MRPVTKTFKAALFSFLIIILCSCAYTSTVERFIPGESGHQGYRKSGDDAVFENAYMKVSARHVNKEDLDEGSLLRELSKKGHVILRMEILNKSDVKVIYSPNQTAFTDDALDYKKPLDYTDLYDASGRDEKRMASIKGRFYDLGTTVLPGEKISRFLIFGPLSKGVRSAELRLSEVYIGTETLNIALPFSAAPEKR